MLQVQSRRNGGTLGQRQVHTDPKAANPSTDATPDHQSPENTDTPGNASRRLWRLPDWPKSCKAELALFKEWGRLQSLAATLSTDSVLPDITEAADLLDFVVSFPGDMLVLLRDLPHPLFFLSQLRGDVLVAWTDILLAEEIQI